MIVGTERHAAGLSFCCGEPMAAQRSKDMSVASPLNERVAYPRFQAVGCRMKRRGPTAAVIFAFSCGAWLWTVTAVSAEHGAPPPPQPSHTASAGDGESVSPADGSSARPGTPRTPTPHIDLGPPPSADAAKTTPSPEPDGYRIDGYREPVPATLTGARRVLSPEEAVELWQSGTAVFIDVYPRAPKPPNLPAGTIWREPTHQTIENAVWVPNVGYGTVSDAIDAYFKRQLEELSAGDRDKAIVFFCLRNCWMSWNAAKRAISYGYSNVMWSPDGTDAWQEIGQFMEDALPRP
jgi:PQQ-dependent catabolism-associated CXXCW motif protein